MLAKALNVQAGQFHTDLYFLLLEYSGAMFTAGNLLEIEGNND